MARYMFIARYTSGGVKGVLTAGGSARRAVIQEMAKRLGGQQDTGRGGTRDQLHRSHQRPRRRPPDP